MYIVAVILMEGGDEEDMKVLEESDEEMDVSRSRNNSESVDKLYVYFCFPHAVPYSVCFIVSYYLMY